ncbi:hypothetical protein D3H55_13880 [Bacillus salacetis]|uniref:Uncharacterized protein n=1 Tax=Bacillus salacetis TaxID=2315464 RepID=A0A3A1QUX5_9BACI|nr:hypothetical protein [Bacillus salacetis]RIW31970.1 hypothetical protein D3H55_13880 [Bacillus salacetis]
MFIGRALYLVGMAFVMISAISIIFGLFTGGGGSTLPFFALLNGMMAMGVGDVVIDLNHRKRLEKLKKDKLE